MVLHADALLIFDVDPTLWKEGMRVWEYGWIGLVENRGHANDGLWLSAANQGNSWGCTTKGEVSIASIRHVWAVNAYSSGYFPFIVVKRTVAWEPLMPSNFTSTKSLGSASAK